ncbi:MAG TPA: aminomethyltransferase family protein, partial [Acidimicrobiia bacterium]|nr:aminomethyltransferase family protein [Acidimicrobiia bacterium]
MIRTTPFHPRTNALNQTGLWEHWSNHLAAVRYQMSEKFEYFAIRNAAGMFDSSPLYKYRISGKDAERYLAGVLARDIRKCRPGRAQYTMWCDDRGFVVEDGVILRLSGDEFLLTSAEPNLAYFHNLIGHDAVEIEEVTDDVATLAFQGPRSRLILSSLAPEMADIGYFHLTPSKVSGAPVTISRTGFTGDLGYEIWVNADDALEVWDAVSDAGQGHGVIPFGQTALLMARIEAGLLLLNADFESSRFAWNDEHRSTPIELGFGWMFRDIETDNRAFIGRKALRRELADATSRWKLVGLMVDWQEYDHKYNSAGLVPPKDHTPVTEEFMVYTDDYTRVGYATSFMYSPMVQRHIAIARVRPEHSALGTRVNLEVTINHRYELVGAHVARLPHFNPERKTA